MNQKLQCERCEQYFDRLEEFKYVVSCMDGTLEYTAKYCSACALVCETESEEEYDD